MIVSESKQIEILYISSAAVITKEYILEVR